MWKNSELFHRYILLIVICVIPADPLLLLRTWHENYANSHHKEGKEPNLFMYRVHLYTASAQGSQDVLHFQMAFLCRILGFLNRGIELWFCWKLLQCGLQESAEMVPVAKLLLPDSLAVVFGTKQKQNPSSSKKGTVATSYIINRDHYTPEGGIVGSWEGDLFVSQA